MCNGKETEKRPYLASWIDRWQMDFFDPPLAFMTVPIYDQDKVNDIGMDCNDIRLCKASAKKNISTPRRHEVVFVYNRTL